MLCELVQLFDGRSILFLGPNKGDDSKAWMVLYDHFRGIDRPKSQSLMDQLTALKMGSRE